MDYSPESNSVQYCLSNGSIHSVSILEENYVLTFFAGEQGSKSSYKKSVQKGNHCEYLFFGRGVLPFVYNVENSVVSWKGKNVKHDELDLEVPISDVDGAFLKEKRLVVLNSTGKVRVYDIRGTNRRPYLDVQVKTDEPKSPMTRMLVSEDEGLYYLANEAGSVYVCDSRKGFSVVGKFKGITTTVTDMAILGEELITCSLDCYVRIFSLETKQVEKKIYLNKPLYSLWASLESVAEEKDFKEEEINLAA